MTITKPRVTKITAPYIFELNTYNVDDAKANCLKIMSALESNKISLKKIENQIDSINQNVDTKGYDISWNNFKNSLNNFINEITISSQTKLDGIFSKDVLDFKVNRADTGHVWVHNVIDSKYGMNSYQVISSKLTFLEDDNQQYKIEQKEGTPGSAIITGNSADVDTDLAGAIVRISGTGNSIFDDKNFKVKEVGKAKDGTTADTKAFEIELGNTSSFTDITSTANINIKFYGSKKAPTKKAESSAGSKKLAVKNTSINSFIGFYIPGINLYLDENQTIDIQILEKNSKLDVDTKDNPAKLKSTVYRISPKYEEKISYTLPTSQIKTNKIEQTGHGFETGQRVQYLNGGDTNATGLTSGSIYYVIKLNNNEFELAESKQNALAESSISITAGTGNNKQSISSVATPKNEIELETYVNKFLYSNVDSNDSTYDDADSKVANDERDNLSQKLDQTILIVKDFYLSPYLNM